MSAEQPKFWEGDYPAEQIALRLKIVEKTDDERTEAEKERYNGMISKIMRMAERLKKEGYEFELTEDRSEFSLRVKGFEGVRHITKVDKQMADIPVWIENSILHPGA